jgi:tetratricopeptide (TPR) repeat protein
MNFISKLKNATGLGLNEAEAYHRAYEKGVLLENYGSAVEMFQKAAEKFEVAGNTDMKQRALANSHLYGFLATRDLSQAFQALPLLEQMQEIEELGSETEVIPAAELAGELRARRVESVALAGKHEAASIIGLHKQASDAFKSILNLKLRTYKYAPAPDRKDTPQERFFLHLGWYNYHQAVQAQWADPAQAGDLFSEALAAFKRANLEEDGRRTESLRDQMRRKRNCWMCHREMQGEQIHYRYAPASVTAYCRSMVRKRGEDEQMFLQDGSGVVLCTTCYTAAQSLAEEIARQRMQELRNEILPALNQLAGAVQALSARVSHLESASHRH